MDLEELKRAGIRFDFCPDAVVPEIPYVEDVLFALRRTNEQKYYDFCVSNHRTYIVNVGLVIAAVSYAIFAAERYDEAEARRIIARAILELCPEEAKCLFNSAYVEAKKIVGEDVPPKDVDVKTLWQLCGCPRCRDRAEEYHAAAGAASSGGGDDFYVNDDGDMDCGGDGDI